MIEPLDPDEILAQRAAAQASADAKESAAAEKFFRGQKLHPFSFGRQAAAQRLQCSESGMESDAMLIFLCTLLSDEIDAARGEEETAKLRRRFHEWADENKIGIASPARKEITRLANEIWMELQAAWHEPEPGKDGERVAPPSPNV